MADRPEFRIYLSSTVEDLGVERQAASEIVRKYGTAGDSYRVNDKGTLETCITDVRNSHLYVGILGHRYGNRNLAR